MHGCVLTDAIRIAPLVCPQRFVNRGPAATLTMQNSEPHISGRPWFSISDKKSPKFWG